MSTTPTEAGERTVVLTIPDDLPQSNNRLLRMHWAERGRVLTRWANYSYAHWYNAGQPRFTRPMVTIRLYFPERRKRDTDNFTAACKGILDGLTGHAWDDDNSEILHLNRVELLHDAKHPRVELTIQEVG